VTALANPDDLYCDTCTTSYPSKGSMYATFESARVKGWHIYQHVQVAFIRSTGEQDVTVETRTLCPKCVGTPRSRLESAPLVLEGQADILEELHYEVEPVEKEGKPHKREMS
jgi:hypothetical protein